MQSLQKLIETTKSVIQDKNDLPFSVYTSFKEQCLLNVPINKPLLIFVLNGCKKLGVRGEIKCATGSFIFLSNSPNIDMRNIPYNEEYFAILIEFEYQDFACLEQKNLKEEKHFQGDMVAVLHDTLLQFIQWSAYAPSAMWELRRQEILQLLYHLGYEQVSAIMESPSLSHKVQTIISANIVADLPLDSISSMLAMSESTLRRKLNAEGSSFQEIKDKARLSLGLHLVQTTPDPIGRIAEQCGYSSQSRFTDKFKHNFGVTPSALRKTRMHD